MAEQFLFEIVENILGKLSSFAFQQLGLAWGLETNLEKIREMLLAIKAVLLDAEQQRAQNQRIQLWLEKLRDIMYDAEDVVDEVECEALRRQVTNSRGSKRKVCRFFSSSNPLTFRFRIACRVKKIKERIVEIAALKSDFGLNEGIKDRVFIRMEREVTHSFVDASSVIGRDEDKEKILEFLLNVVAGENVSILPIVGMGGLGKTTVAKLVYNDERVASHFQEKLWVCVSNEFDLQKVLTKIIKSATGENCTDWDVERLQRFLRDTLNGKKYLLILDDVWNEDPSKWRELKALLMASAEGTQGSKIVVTTRSNRVASIMGSVPPYNLNDLSHKNCSSLFFNCVFRDEQVQDLYPNLMKIGEEIVGKCQGVPLAVITLGNLLYSNTSEHDWKSIRDSEIWRLEQKEKDILPALRISYEQLPFHLKRCFAYCSFFPKDHEYFHFELIRFWMALGLLHVKNDSENLEEIGLHYFNELCCRSFFQDFEENFGIISCRMHDLVHDLATSLTQNECLIITSRTWQISKSIRHLLVAEPNSLPKDFLTVLKGSESDRVRTITPFNGEGINSKSIIQSCLLRFRYLRFLNLSYSDLVMLPEEIGSLKHLRFLNLSYSKVKRLPSSLYKLQNLQSLWFGGCHELEEFSCDIRYLISLRSLMITTKQKCLPKNGIECLKSLHLLAICDSKNFSSMCKDMQGFTNLQSLAIGRCPSLMCLPLSMKYLTSLEKLFISRCVNLNLNMVEGKNNQDITRFHLKKLILGSLPKLVYFPEWLLQGSIDTLQILQLKNCDNLRELPASIRSLTSLQKLIIEDCDQLSQRCKPQTGEDWSKIAHIPKIIIDGKPYHED